MDLCSNHPRAVAVMKCVACKGAVCAECREGGERGVCGPCTAKKRAAEGRPVKGGPNGRSDVVYCFRHEDIRAAAACATCDRPYCPACLNTSGVCGVCARVNKDAQARVYGANEKGRAVIQEMEAEAIKKKLRPRDWAVVAALVIGVGVSYKVLTKPQPKLDPTIETMQRHRESALSASEAAMIASLKREKRVALKEPPPEPAADLGTQVGRTYAGAIAGAQGVAAAASEHAAAVDAGGAGAGQLEIQAVAPADGAIVGGTAHIRAAVGGAPGRVTCEVDGAVIGSSGGRAPSFAWNTRAAGNGPHSVTITAFGAGGSTSTSFTLNVMNR